MLTSSRYPSSVFDERSLAPLIERARSGDLEAFEDIVRRFQQPIRSFAGRMMRDPHLGDDATQETFYRLWKGLPRHTPRGKFAAWTFTVARNTCIELLRREARVPRPVDEPVAGLTDPYPYIDLKLVISDAVARLAEPYRSTILLRQIGMEHDEMAKTLGCPVSTVRTRLHRARAQLQGSVA